jgi:8-oxo-dGTP pyrophosphatase MutT (NUDIX family)
MELNSEMPTTAPRNAATVVMLRDTPLGLEVFLVKRHGLSDVLGGAYVFPGGKLDDSDCHPDALSRLDQSAEQLHGALGEPELSSDTAAGLFVAAVREAFEEASILFAADAPQADATPKPTAGLPFNQWMASQSLRLDTHSLAPWSRWITPRMPSVSSKRFDTRFFIAAVPSNQVARHDDFETTESVWLRPREALTQYWNGQIELAPPQIMSLAHLARHATVQAAMQGARSGPPPLIFPETFDLEGTRVLCYPGDPAHSVAVRALPGPTRLLYRNRRFEPLEGFESLFG